MPKDFVVFLQKKYLRSLAAAGVKASGAFFDSAEGTEISIRRWHRCVDIWRRELPQTTGANAGGRWGLRGGGGDGNPGVGRCFVTGICTQVKER